MYYGLLIWGILFLLLLVLAFIAWKFLVKEVTRYDNRKREIALGLGTGVLVFATFLFFPLVLYGMGNVSNEVSQNLQEKIVENSHELYKTENTKNLTNMLNEIIKEYPAEISTFTNEMEDEEKTEFVSKFESLKENSIETAVDAAIKFKDNKNFPFKETLDMAMELLTVNGKPLFKDVPDEYLVDKIQDMFNTYNERAKLETVKNPMFSKMLSGTVNNTSFTSITGVADRVVDSQVKKTKKHTSMLMPKTIILIVSGNCLIVLLLIIVILYHLRESENEQESEIKKTHIFEYQKTVFDELNKEKK